MALVKSDYKLEKVVFEFNGAGEVEEVKITANFAISDNTTGTEETRVRKEVAIWGLLNTTQRNHANIIGKKLLDIAKLT